MSNYFQNYRYEIKDGKACVTGWDARSTTAEVPEEIDGYQVVEIAAYAFSEQGKDQAGLYSLEEIFIPKTVERIGRYAFYNCRNLKRIQFYNTVKDLGAGAFTGCHNVSEIDVTFLENEKSCLKEFLIDLPEEQTIFYRSENGEARLVFPEYFEEAVENTPARILETHTHGSGMMYRNCFVQQELKFSLYDERFDWAEGCEFKETLFRLAFDRLLYPYQLGEKAEQKYRRFLRTHLFECAEWASKNQREKEMYYLTDHCVEKEEDLEILIQAGNRYQTVGVLSYLMDYKHRNFKTKRKTFEL